MRGADQASLLGGRSLSIAEPGGAGTSGLRHYGIASSVNQYAEIRNLLEYPLRLAIDDLNLISQKERAQIYLLFASHLL